LTSPGGSAGYKSNRPTSNPVLTGTSSVSADATYGYMSRIFVATWELGATKTGLTSSNNLYTSTITQ
jgi:hypothetical protein